MAGDIGVVVHVYEDAKAYEVEFIALDGNTLAFDLTVIPVPDRVRDDGSGVHVFLFDIAEQLLFKYQCFRSEPKDRLTD